MASGEKTKSELAGIGKRGRALGTRSDFLTADRVSSRVRQFTVYAIDSSHSSRQFELARRTQGLDESKPIRVIEKDGYVMVPSIDDVVRWLPDTPLELCVRYDLSDPQRLSTSQELINIKGGVAKEGFLPVKRCCP